jgi:hypothetical protein
MTAKSTRTKSPRTRTKWRTLKAMKDSDIDYSDIPKPMDVADSFLLPFIIKGGQPWRPSSTSSSDV